MRNTKPIKPAAGIAGLLYLGVILTGLFTLMYVPSRLFSADNASSLYQHIASSPILLRLGIVGGLVCYVFFLFLSLALYHLLSPVNESYARLMVLLVALSVPVFFLNMQNLFSVLSLIREPENSFSLTTAQARSQISLYVNQYKNGLRIVHIFSGLWLFPFGYLVYKSGFLPKVLGIFLMLGCLGYLLNFVANTLFPDYAEWGISSYISLPASMGEIGICLWLLLMGVKGKIKTDN